MKVRAFFSTLAIVAVALLVVGIGGFVGLTSRGPLVLLSIGGQDVPAATPFVPKNAPLMVSLLTRPDRLSDLWLRLAAPQNRRQAQAEVTRLERSLLAGTGLTYENDIRPWLGNEITFAVTDADLDRDPENGNQPGYLLVMSCRDSERAKAVLEFFWQQRAIAGDSLVFEQFAGSRLIYARQLGAPGQPAIGSGSPRTIASALVGQQFLLLSNDPNVIQRSLTAAQSKDLNLEQDLGYRKALDSFSSDRIALAVVNLPASLQWLGLSTQPALSLATADLGSAGGVFDRAIFSLRPHRQGLLADTALLAAAGHPFQPQRVSDTAAAAGQFLPADTPLAAVGSNLTQLWQDVAQALPYYGAAAPALQPVWKALQLPLADQPTESLLGWIQNDYALGLASGSLATPGWVLAAQPPQEGNSAIAAQLDQLARNQGLSVGPLAIGGQTVSAWTHLSLVAQPGSPRGSRNNTESDLAVATAVDGLHTQLKGYELLSNSPTALYRALQSADQSLLSTPQWQQMTAAFSQPNGGYLYADWQALKPDLLNQTPWLRLIETVGQPLLSHLQAVAVTSYGRDEQIQSGSVFLRLSSS